MRQGCRSRKGTKTPTARLPEPCLCEHDPTAPYNQNSNTNTAKRIKVSLMDISEEIQMILQLQTDVCGCLDGGDLHDPVAPMPQKSVILFGF
jgi:hypothetical protein